MEFVKTTTKITVLCLLVVAHVNSQDPVTFTITGQSAGLVFDATEKQIQGKEQEECKTEQQWIFRKTNRGNFLIESQANQSEVLVVQGDFKEGANIIRYGKNGNLRQEWTFPVDGRIKNAQYRAWAITQQGAKLFISKVSDSVDQVFFIRPC